MRSTLTGACNVVAFDWLVAAETPTSRSALATALDLAGVAHVAVGDCVAPRRASLAIYEARRVALTI